MGILRGPLKYTSYSRLLRGSDDAPDTADDGLLAGYTLSGDQQIAAGGVTAYGGTYTARIEDDPSDPNPDPLVDGNVRVILRCTGTLPDGSSATVKALVWAIPFPGIVVDGPLSIPGNPVLQGPCGGAHANGTFTISGNPTAETYFASASNIAISGSPSYAEGPYPDRPPLEVPELRYADFCPSEADYIMQSNGTIVRTSDGATFNGNSGWGGWKRSSSSPVLWETTGPTLTATGVLCFEGNVKIGSSPGTAASPVVLSIYATGSVEISGNPYLAAAPEQPLLILSEGDVKLNGNPTAGAINYGGAIYARSQCQVSGNATINSQLICKNLPNDAGDINHFGFNEISGNATITYDCNGLFSGPRIIASWWQRFGS
jgi:hypothetical protein